MAGYLLVVDRKSDFPALNGESRMVVEADDYIANPEYAAMKEVKVINLCRSYRYLSTGYYSSLLAEARGQKAMPSAETMLELNWKRIYSRALPELEDIARKIPVPMEGVQVAVRLNILFGDAGDPRFLELGRRVFDLFRCPLLFLEMAAGKKGWEIEEIKPIGLKALDSDLWPRFETALERYTKGRWSGPRPSKFARYDIAILYDPDEKLPPSDMGALKKLIKAGAKLNAEVELITRKDFSRLNEFDALLIRETTRLNHHTYRFAKKAEAEGIPVIDDARSILKCTNKVYLAELLRANKISHPRTLLLDDEKTIPAEQGFGWPLVLKVPDSSFSAGVFKAKDEAEYKQIAADLLKGSDVIIAQEYIYTEFDWRIGVLAGKALFACKYFMAKNHWQIIDQKKDKNQTVFGDSAAVPLESVPAAVLDTAIRAANLIGNGFYGVDLKERDGQVYVIEVNDNPNLEAGEEDAVGGQDIYGAIMGELIRRIELPAGEERRRQPRRSEEGDARIRLVTGA